MRRNVYISCAVLSCTATKFNREVTLAGDGITIFIYIYMQKNEYKNMYERERERVKESINVREKKRGNDKRKREKAMVKKKICEENNLHSVRLKQVNLPIS